jgi:hypothetical protein
VITDSAFASEEDFQKATLGALSARLSGQHGPGFTATSFLSPFGFDAGIALRTGSRANFKFLEFKAWKAHRAGGIGFGNGKGEGCQVQLLSSSQSTLTIFDDLVLWCFADLTLPAGSPRFSTLDCSTAKRAAMGVVRCGKQNNFRRRDVFAQSVSWDAFIARTYSFLTS